MDAAWLANSERRTINARDGGGRDRRVDDRFDLNRAPGRLLYKGTCIPYEMLDVSLSGCRLRALEPFAAGALESVKVTFSIHGMALSLWGVTQWTTWDRLVGIRFIHASGRTRNELAGLLTCLLDNSATDVVKQAVAAAAAEADSPITALEHPLAVEPEPVFDEDMEDEDMQAEEFQEPPAPPPAPKRPELRSEHKVLSLEVGESPAVVHLVAEGTTLAGNVLDVSQDGCMVRLARPLAVRMNAQAEVDFRLRGLHFILPGMTKFMHDDRLVEIRFTEMSRRKRDDLSQVIMELLMLSEAANAKP
jgi:hypothetical protein